MFTKFFNWLSSYTTNTARVLVSAFAFISILALLWFIGLIADGVGIGQFLAKNNAGTGGQVAFWFFACIWAVGLLTAFFGERE